MAFLFWKTGQFNEYLDALSRQNVVSPFEIFRELQSQFELKRSPNSLEIEEILIKSEREAAKLNVNSVPAFFVVGIPAGSEFENAGYFASILNLNQQREE